MSSNQAPESGRASGFPHAFTRLCLRPCRKVLAQIRKVKGAIFTEWRDGLKDHEGMLRLALNEAEALACQTAYPHLLFPALAAEKIQGVLAWSEHQQAVRTAQPIGVLETSPASVISGNRDGEPLRHAA